MKSRYKYVYFNKRQTVNDPLVWKGKVGRVQRNFKTEHEAAKWVDLRLISLGKEPVNILKRK